MAKRTFNDSAIPFDHGITSHSRSEYFKKHDHLSIHDYVIALGKFIEECETPMSIGIQGDWGIGKTSLLNMVRSYLWSQQHRSIESLYFNTWQYSLFNQDDLLGPALINALLDGIRDEFGVGDTLYEGAKGPLKKVLRAVSVGVNVPGIRVNMEGKQLAAKESEFEADLHFQDIARLMLDFRSAFEKIVEEVTNSEKGGSHRPKRLVVFIDDLDRVRPVKAIELLEALKNFVDVRNCIFVLAVDYEVIQSGMAEKLGTDIQERSGKSFFDKLIQLPFTMPTGSYDLVKYVGDVLKTSGFVDEGDLKDGGGEFYAEMTECTIGRNPRSIKRVANYAHLMEGVRLQNTSQENRFRRHDRKVLFGLICMQIAWPEVFDYFVRNPSAETVQNLEDWSFLDSIPGILSLWERSEDVEQVKSNIGSFFDLLFSLVDADGNGVITTEEFAPIFNVLHATKLTSVSEYQSPFDVLSERIRSYSNSDHYSIAFCAFSESKWKSSPRVTMKQSGSRYSTIVVDRRQAGTVVTLKTRPFLLRLVADPDTVREALEGVDGIGERAMEIVQGPPNWNVTGFGETFVDVESLQGIDEQTMKCLFDALFDVCARPAVPGEVT